MKKTLLFILLAISLVPNISLAADPVVSKDEYKLLEPLPCIEGVGTCEPGTYMEKITIKDYILYIYKFSIAIGVFLAILMIIWGGFQYVTSEIPYTKSDGKSKIENAVKGLIMIFVSYLILRTIDPRLVNVYTTIEPIKYDLAKINADDKNFQGALAEDLNRLSQDSQLKYAEENARIADLKKQKEALDAKISKGDITGVELEALKVESEKLKGQIRNGEINQKVQLAENTGLFQYAKALDALNNPESEADNVKQYVAKTIPNTLDKDGLLPITGENIIQQDYNRRINDIKRSVTNNEDDANTNFDKIQALEKQRDFILQQVVEDVVIKEKLKNGGFTTVSGGQGSVYKVDNIPYLKEKVKTYTADAVDANKIKSSGLSKEEYAKIYQARINTINEFLGTKAP